MRLRSLIAMFALGMAFLPLSLLPMAGLFIGTTGKNASPLSLSVHIMRVVMDAVRVDDSGVLVPKDGFIYPPRMSLTVTDELGQVILSNFPGIEPGERITTESLSTFISPAPGNRFVADRLTADGRIVGAYIARVPSGGMAITVDPAWQFIIASMALVTAILVLAASGLFSTRLVRGFRTLEKAAGRISKGDLGTAVTVQGVKEIAALAAAMESMRQSLREDTARRARFLAGVSHDLRTPLTSIRGYLEAVEDGLAENPDTLSRYLAIMGQKTGILEERISELLDFARMGSGEWRFRFSDLELEPFLRHRASEYAEDAQAQNRRFTCSLTGLGSMTVRADEKMLARALENIFTNALRYTPEGSTIELATWRTENAVFIEFTDDGPGIPKEELSLIFEPWFRGKTSTGETTGLGLGLSISRSIITDHGWTLSAYSRPGGGSRFRVEIPA